MTLLPILLPKGYKPKVAVGQKITAGKALAQKLTGSKDEVVHLAKDLGISPKAAIKSLKKTLGSRFEKGDIIAIKKKFGLGKKQIISEFSGTLVKIEEDTGDLFVRIASDEEALGEPIISPVDGIVDFCDNEKIVLKTEKTTILVEKSSGKGVRGNLLILNKKEIEDEDVKKEVEEKIVAGQCFEKAAIFKILAMGGLGIIALNSCEQDLKDVFERSLNKPIFLISEENYKKLEKYQGGEVYLDAENKAIVIL
jgi:hypothetical protein